MTADTLLSKVIFTRDLIPYKQDEIIPDDQISTKETPEINTQDAIKPVMADQKGNRPALRNGSKNLKWMLHQIGLKFVPKRRYPHQ